MERPSGRQHRQRHQTTVCLARQRPAAASLRRIETEQSLELIDERGDLRLLVD